MIRYPRILFLFLSFLLFAGGCWDKREIEELGFIVGIALDKASEEGPEEETEEVVPREHTKHLITVTLQRVVPKAFAGGEGGGEKREMPFINRSATGDSIPHSIRELMLTDDRLASGEHTKVLVFGEELARNMNMQHLTDRFLRGYEVRLSPIVLIAKGRASDTLEVADPGEIPAFKLIGIADNERKTARLLPAMTLAKVSTKMSANSSFLLQTAIAKDNKVKFAGGAVIKGSTKRLIGFLKEEELKGLNWLTGRVKGDLVKGFDEKTHRLLVYEPQSISSNIQPHVQGEKIFFDVEIETEGTLYEDWIPADTAFDNQFLKRVERATQREIKRLAGQTLKKIQKQYKADVAGFGDQLRIQYPRVWQKVKKDWDKEFSRATVNVDVKVTVRDYQARDGK
ncbi:Ger(x)C family spore germination protein [Paenactinomyces guangxiensis]|uniref:Ger(X)C family spore germination protein n=1 Tax=Paenactinomyces guangxiensis TaxID=1490290 RepID=A0A7W1WQQ3_9BACL|nr:Ger(x)C family spore germination protein [Paenactinomyces guangxiensis]MBA4494295.1 Ger(x)C family spore germination protein [Paenactinomyces guangxiensis]MBH8590789.1 Ger(x)C family spore germination protein [Paenactinomyces guangxiensis]